MRDNDGSKSRQLSPSIYNALGSRVEVKLGRLTERTRVLACLSQLALKRVFIRTCGFFFCFFSPLWPNCETNGSAEGFGKQRMTVLLQNVTPLDVGPRERLHVFPFSSIASRYCGLNSAQQDFIYKEPSQTKEAEQSAAQILGDTGTDT